MVLIWEYVWYFMVIWYVIPFLAISIIIVVVVVVSTSILFCTPIQV